jgi:hypothetical protein
MENLKIFFFFFKFNYLLIIIKKFFISFLFEKKLYKKRKIKNIGNIKIFLFKV